jgi:ABC-type antimicrobial peptide transport system ATPase subunit
VIAADAFITTNIKPAIGLANRMPVVCHSLLFNNYQIQEQILLLISDDPDTGLNPLPYESEIILNDPPTAINVEIK